MGRNKNKVDIPLPDWATQLRAMGMSDKSIKDMTFHPGDHDFFIAMNETFQDALTGEMKIMIEDALKAANTAVCKEVTKIVTDHTNQVGETYIVMMKAIEGLDKTTKRIEQTVMSLNERQSKTEERITKEEVEIKIIKERLDRKKERLDRIEKMMLQRDAELLEKIGDLEHDTAEIASALGLDPVKIRTNRKVRILKYVAIVAIAVAISAAMIYFAIREHAVKTIHNPTTEKSISK